MEAPSRSTNKTGSRIDTTENLNPKFWKQKRCYNKSAT